MIQRYDAVQRLQPRGCGFGLHTVYLTSWWYVKRSVVDGGDAPSLVREKNAVCCIFRRIPGPTIDISFATCKTWCFGKLRFSLSDVTPSFPKELPRLRDGSCSHDYFMDMMHLVCGHAALEGALQDMAQASQKQHVWRILFADRPLRLSPTNFISDAYICTHIFDMYFLQDNKRRMSQQSTANAGCTVT
jgi:hypothetical protein